MRGVFEPADSPDLPAVVLAFAAARRRWLPVAYDPDRDHDGIWVQYRLASEAMRRELEARGGRWEVGGLIYHWEDGRGIGIEQAPAARAEVAGTEAASGSVARRDDDGDAAR